MLFRSECHQDLFLETYVFKGLKNKYFVDVGAHNGDRLSNSWFFEKEREWKGICIEPHPKVFEQLKACRSAICLNICAAPVDGPVQFDFIDHLQYSLHCGIIDNYKEGHLACLKGAVGDQKIEQKTITLPAKSLATVFKEHNVKEVDFLSVDTEGGELEIIQSIDFNTTFVHVLSVEDLFDSDITIDLAKLGFVFIRRVGIDLVFIHKDSPYLKVWQKNQWKAKLTFSMQKSVQKRVSKKAYLRKLLSLIAPPILRWVGYR